MKRLCQRTSCSHHHPIIAPRTQTTAAAEPSRQLPTPDIGPPAPGPNALFRGSRGRYPPGAMDRLALEACLAALGLSDLRPIAGGHQSLAVYEARLDDQHVAVKVLEARSADRAGLDARLEVVSRLAAAADEVCAPVPVRGRLVSEVGPEPTYAIAYEFAEGTAPDLHHPEEAALMGRALADLHASMAALPPVPLPALAAFPPPSDLATVADDVGVPAARVAEAPPNSPQQLLHGDFSSKNVRVAGERWRVFDFDDCGYGPVELDLANSLYFVLFEALTGPGPEHYLQFRDTFLAGYRDRSGHEPADAVLDGLITRRVVVLATWLTDPATASPGVRAASKRWRTTLGNFVRDYVAALDR